MPCVFAVAVFEVSPVENHRRHHGCFRNVAAQDVKVARFERPHAVGRKPRRRVWWFSRGPRNRHSGQKPSKLLCIMAFIPFAPPIRRTNMNTPQKIPKAVRRDRDLLRISVWKISLHLSISNMILSYLALRATIGLIENGLFLRGRSRPQVPR